MIILNNFLPIIFFVDAKDVGLLNYVSKKFNWRNNYVPVNFLEIVEQLKAVEKSRYELRVRTHLI